VREEGNKAKNNEGSPKKGEERERRRGRGRMERMK
jgi:hypothetical protein